MSSITTSGIALTDTVSGHSTLPSNVFINSSVINAETTINWADWGGFARQVIVRFIVWTYDPLYESNLYYERQTYDLAAAQYTSGSKTFNFTYTPGSGSQYFGECFCEIEYSMNSLYDEDNYASQDFDRYSYSIPSISSFSVNRCLADGTDSATGTSAEFDLSFVITSLGSTNTKALSVKYRQSGTTSWSSPLTVNITSLGYSASISDSFITGGTFLSNSSYDIQVTLSDCISTVTNTGTIQAADAFVHFNADKTQIAFGKYCESTGTGFDKPGFDVNMTARFRDGVQYDVAPTIVSGSQGTFMAGFIPCSILSAPTAESVTYNATSRLWFIPWQTEQKNGTFSSITGGTDTRKLGWLIPATGFYEIDLNAYLSSSASSNFWIAIYNLTSSWTPETATNYTTEAAITSYISQMVSRAYLPVNSGLSFGQISATMYCTSGSKVFPTVWVSSENKTINSTNTRASIRRVG